MLHRNCTNTESSLLVALFSPSASLKARMHLPNYQSHGSFLFPKSLGQLQAHIQLLEFPDVCAQSLSHVWLSSTLWTVAQQAPLSMRYFRQEYWHGLSFPPPRDLPDSGIEPAFPASPAPTDRFFTAEPPGKLRAPSHILNEFCLHNAKKGDKTETLHKTGRGLCFSWISLFL